MRRIIALGVMAACLIGGCVGGIGNKTEENTYNSVNVIVQGETPIKVLDQAGNWIDVGGASPSLLAARGVVYMDGSYQYIGPQESAQYVK